MNENLLDSLDRGPDMLRSLLEIVPAERVDRTFGEGIWSIRQNVHHLVMTQLMMLKRIDQFLNEAEVRITPFTPENEPSPADDRPLDELVSKFESLRKKQLEKIRSASDELWDRKGFHPEYSPYTFGISIWHIYLHDCFHFNRIEDLGFLNPELIRSC